MPCDLFTRCNPGATLSCYVLKNLLQGSNPPRSRDHAQVQADGQHPRLVSALAPEPVVGCAHVFCEFPARAKSLCVLELHVIGIKGIGQHQMVAIADRNEIGCVVVVGVAVIEKAVLNQ